MIRTVGRILLGLLLTGAGIGHWTFARDAFQAQVPPWLPLDKDFVVLASGVVEIALGLAVLLTPRRLFGLPARAIVGWVAGVLRRDLPGQHLAAGHVGRDRGAG